MILDVDNDGISEFIIAVMDIPQNDPLELNWFVIIWKGVFYMGFRSKI